VQKWKYFAGYNQDLKSVDFEFVRGR
jgi:hypothetical protein